MNETLGEPECWQNSVSMQGCITVCLCMIVHISLHVNVWCEVCIFATKVNRPVEAFAEVISALSLDVSSFLFFLSTFLTQALTHKDVLHIGTLVIKCKMNVKVL